MGAFRLGRSSVRFLHSYPTARVSYLNFDRVTALQTHRSAIQQSQFTKSIYAIVRGYADQPVGRPKQHTGRAPARKPRAATGGKATTKPATEKKSPTKKKSAAKKATAKKPVRERKELTPEQIVRRADKAKAEKIRKYKELSLKKETPKGLPSTAWTVFMAEQVKLHNSGKGTTTADTNSTLKRCSQEYKALSAEQREHYNHVANQNKVAAQEQRRKWVESHSAQEIKAANNARQQLSKLGVDGYASYIKDERQVKGAARAYILFLQDRHASGDMKGLSVTDAGRLIAGEWKDLPESEKEKYNHRSAQDTERYKKEHLEVYGVAPRDRRSKVAKQT